MSIKSMYDVAIIGGGAAGLEAAIILARTRSNVVVIDAGKQSNLVTSTVGAAFTRDGVPPRELYTLAREQVLDYPTATIINDTVLSVTSEGQFNLILVNGQAFTAFVLILAQGMEYTLPPIEGLS